ncbi:MAG: response regulator, partial [Prochlorothrix sp.]
WATPPQGLGHRAAPGDSQTVQGGNPAKLQPELQLELQPDLQPDLQAPSGAPTAPPGPANPAPTPPALGDPSASPQTTSNFSFLGPTSPLFPRSPWPSAANTLHDRSISLLLAEDNEANIITLKSYLEAKGYRLQVVRDGQEALAAIERSAFDLILLDIQMPGLDGLSVMRSIRNGTALPNVPIIALTALAMKGDQERCLAAGATNYIHKPIRMNQLHHLIQETLGLSH